MKIDGHSKIIGIFGWPLDYTLSPAFQNAGLEKAGVNAAYLPFPVEPAAFPSLWRALSKAPNFMGANVTNPHKVAALRLAQRLSPEARAIGAVNTFYRRGRTWVGHNTDAAGFLAALPLSPKGRRCIIFGAGGTARAAAYALLKSGASSVNVACRRPAQGRELFRALKAPASRRRLRNLGGESLASMLRGMEIAVNTIPGAAFASSLGRAAAAAKQLRAAFDASYATPGQPFLRALPSRVKRGSGKDMLLEQGCLSFKLWTGKAAPKAQMRRALGH